jgi:hypothetical protein
MNKVIETTKTANRSGFARRPYQLRITIGIRNSGLNNSKLLK